ncbi:MAG: MarR family transcriptional regulator [Lachnospiraceae bacterium]|nr:MarR family transcriptional regulator [Lachnospiraceae bacterium]
MESKRHQVVNLFIRSDQVIRSSIECGVKDTGLHRSQHRILMILGKHPDCSQTMLARKLEVSPAAVAVALKKLEKSGYIERQSVESDNRMNHVVVTPKGMEAIRVSCAYFQEVENVLLDGFSEEDLDILERFLKKVIQNGENYYRPVNEKKGK